MRFWLSGGKVQEVSARVSARSYSDRIRSRIVSYLSCHNRSGVAAPCLCRPVGTRLWSHEGNFVSTHQIAGIMETNPMYISASTTNQ